jgi:putative spermidine/putrescine transport system permease protein
MPSPSRILLWIVGGAVGLMLLAPILIVIPLSLSSSPFLQFPPPGYSFHWFSVFVHDQSWLDAIWLSARVAAGAVVVSVLVGIPAAYALVRGKLGLAWLIEPLLILPMAVPIIVYAIGAYMIALRLDWVGSVWILIAAHSVIALPYVVLNISAALRTTDYRLELVAQSLGAHPFTAFRQIILPMIAPAVWASALITIVLSADEAVAALFLASDTAPTLPVKLYTSIFYELNPLVPVASTVVIAGTLTVGIIYLATSLMTARRWQRRGGAGLPPGAAIAGVAEE